MDSAVRIIKLTRLFKPRQQAAVIANDNLTLEVPRGSIFGILGENGAGKTTLVHQLLGLLSPTSGEIWVEGVDVVRFPEQVKSLIGFLPQTAVPLRYVSVRQALYMTGRLRGQGDVAARQQTDDLLARLDLTQQADHFVHTLSGGLLRTTNFAMALMGYPRVVVLDEPTNNLDPARRRLIWETIRALNTEKSLTCLLVTHNLLEAETVLQRLCVIRHGRIIAQGTPSDLKATFENRIHLEFRLKEDITLAPEHSTRLMQYGQLEKIGDNHYRLLTYPAELLSPLDVLIHTIGVAHIAEFSVLSPSLEDVYLQLQENATHERLP